MKFYSTGEVAKKLTISVRALRYYDQIGLMTPSEKDEYGKRLYNDEDLLTLQKITILKMLNLSLNDIGKILSKITIEQLLHAHKKSLQQKMEDLNNSIKSTNTILNIINMEGDLNWEQLIPLILEAQKKNDKDMKWNEYFDQQEQVTLKKKLPKMEIDNPQIRHWINIIKRIELCIERGDTPDSIEAQIIAEDTLELSNELFDGNEELEVKFFEIRKSPEKSRDLNLYPVKEDVLHFVDEAIQFYLDKRNHA
ncbi:MerR family transcriptional regulator [Oceanobacillus bengalensis]|uniref:MerR family transcriptional regulator n=1 Tax=Oceanobacillus bengalensis TaxID=1435466 RepID=A0A494YTL7_9BACI|nr:MerR family transcriptional regulator [Oceanobacillus bengalensis]RKQ13416.1 MerR family transcriptional regulator [Oceanobacillus bengalensis]